MAGLHEIYGEDDPDCFDFDLACALRLEIQERKERENMAKLIAYEVGKLFADSNSS